MSSSSEVIAAVVPILPVRDLTRAIEFYEHLGFTTKPYRDGDFYAFIKRDGRELHLSKTPELVPEHNFVRVYFLSRLTPGKGTFWAPRHAATLKG